jgi:hypothetical protein
MSPACRKPQATRHPPPDVIDFRRPALRQVDNRTLRTGRRSAIRYARADHRHVCGAAQTRPNPAKIRDSGSWTGQLSLLS